MLTNILASIVITLVTNVTTTDNAVYEWNIIPNGAPSVLPIGTIQNPPSAHFVQHPIYYEPRKQRGRMITPPTEKTETTTVTEVSTLEFTWNGEKRSVPNGERVVSSKSVTLRKKEEWVKSEDEAGLIHNNVGQHYYITNPGPLHPGFLASITNHIK